MVEQPQSRRRFTAIYVAMTLMFVLLAGQLYNIQILRGKSYLELARDNRERVIPLKAGRGIFYDRTGKRLVTNDPSYSVAVTAADVPDINCAAGSLDTQVKEAKVFRELARRLSSKYVIVVRPADLPLSKVGEVANRLSVILATPADILRAPLKDTMNSTPTSKNLFTLRKDLGPEIAKAVEAQLSQLPGIKVFNELELNFVNRFDSCLKAAIIKRGVDYNTMQSIETNRSELQGVTILPEPVRQYADGSLLSHLLGYVGPIDRETYETHRTSYEPDDKIGQTGLEAGLEDHLKGTKGSARVIVNSKERVVTQIAAQAPITGNNVTLTIDSDLQRAVTNALQDGIAKAKVKAGVAIVMRVDDGRVLSMVSLPSYDNNLFANGISQTDFDRLNGDTTLPMFDRAVGGAYPPGSTFKMITAAAALQEGVVNRDTTIYCPGFIEVPYTWSESTRNRFRDWKVTGHGTLNVEQALTVSSDVFFYIASGPRQEDRRIHNDDGTDKVVWTRYYTPGARQPTEFNGLGIAKLHEYATQFGIGEKTGIELPGESNGLAPSPDWKIKQYPDNPWSLGDTLVTAIGQGYDLVTPLQLVNVTAAIANGGTIYKPKLVEKITGWGGQLVQGYQPSVLGKVAVSPENLAIVRAGMREVVADKKRGTAASHITLQSVSIAGKTGTAEYGEKIGEKNGKEVRRSHAWFTAFAPYEKPEIAVVVLLEGGEESLEGSTFAVPVTDNIMKAYFHKDK